MSDARWERIKSIIGRSLELEGVEREAYLERACGGDAELRSEIDSFLARGTVSSASEFLEPPALLRAAGGPFVLGDFELVRELGRGGMGVVYLARQKGLEREVAVKVLVEGPSTSPTSIERFHREARAAARLRHPGIVQVIVDGRTENAHWFAMEYVPGHDLAREIQLQRTGHVLAGFGAFLPPMGAPNHLEQVARVCADIADALHYSHLNGLVHRDIKPHNILMQPDGRVQIGDFGLVRDELLGSLTLTGEIAGTLPYMSPEQARIRKVSVDHRTDVYSLGVVLYKLATLERPFQGATSAEILTKILRDDPRRMRRINARVPRDLETICGKAMAKDPRARYADAKAFADDLRRFIGHEAIHATPPSLLSRARSKVVRHQRLVAAGAMLALGLGVGSWYTLGRVRAADRASAWVAAFDRAGQPLAGEVRLRAIDRITGVAGAGERLGALPLEAVSIASGFQRIVVVIGADVRELTRDVIGGDEVRITIREVAAPPVDDDMVRVEGGTLYMRDGIRLSPLDGRQIDVEPFLIDRCEVSNAQYRQFVAETGHTAPTHWNEIRVGEHDNLPVVEVGWRDALSYAEWAGKRLPTFAEWMWAARGAENRMYPWAATDVGAWRGNTQRPTASVTPWNSIANYFASVEGVRTHADACTPNGLFHMLGNVTEWTETAMAEWKIDGFAAQSGRHVVVGPAWDAASFRGFMSTLAWFGHDGIESTYANVRTGFRCAKSLLPTSHTRGDK